jgi:hypothetical protein
MSAASELYRSALTGLRADCSNLELPDLKALFQKTVGALEERHGGFVLVLDEAQNLGDAVLNELAELIDFSPGRPQVVLSGQPKLSEMLRRSEHANVTKHLKGEYVLAPLLPSEVSAYIHHRLCVAGYTGNSLFSESAIALIASASGGVPRVINNICWTVMSTDVIGEYSEADVRHALEILRLEALCDDVPRRGAELSGSAASSSLFTNPVDPVLLSSALHTWLRKKVRWSGTAGELLSELSATESRLAPPTDSPSPADVVDALKTQSAALSSQGIAVDFITQEGLPLLITLQLTAALPKPPVRVAPQAEVTKPIEHSRPKGPPNPRQNRWRAIHVWAFTSLLALAGIAFTFHKRSQSTFVRAAETVPTSGDQELQFKRQSAEAGDPVAQRELAIRYLDGTGVTADRAIGLRLLREAANNRDPEAQYLLGANLAATDKPEAYKWLVISHLAGNDKSFAELQRLTHELTPNEIGKVRYELGLAYASGEGTDIDYVRAYTWMTLAAAAGISESKQKLTEFSQKMSQEEIASASRQSSAWLARMRTPQIQARAPQD